MIRAENIKKSFGNLLVLKGIDFEAKEAEVLSIVGASGAGKSSLLQILGTLSCPDTGKVYIDGTDVFSLGSNALSDFRNKRIGFVFQFHHLLPEFTALENVMMPALIARISRSKARETAAALLEDVGLGQRMAHRPGELSGGEQQRVAIARALVLEPELLLADEPTGNLDMKTSDGIHAMLTGLQIKKGLTLVIVTHNERLAAAMGTTIHLLDGKVEKTT